MKTKKKCSDTRCAKKQPLPIAHFSVRPSTGKLYGQCDDCIAARHARYYESNNKKINLERRSRYKNDLVYSSTIRDKVNKYSNSPHGKKVKQKYFKKHRVQIRENKNLNEKKRRKSDPSYKLRVYVSNIVRSDLKGAKKGKAVWNHLPYSCEELKTHLESLFEPWMNWSNHGNYSKSRKTWHIDHIVPQSDLPYLSMKDKNFKLCWSLNNLRPLAAQQNIIEGSRRTRHKKKKG